jgi:hypothetical protein
MVGRIGGVTAAVGSLSDIPAGAGRFDAVILSHVLEHVRDLAGSLQYLRTFLEGRAAVYAEVPDASRYADFTWSPFQDFNTEHINHLTRESLTNLFALNGFETTVAGQKTILSAPGMPYPAVFAVAAMGPLPAGNDALHKDTALAGRLRTYTETSNRLLADIDRHLRQLLEPRSEVVVWGTGELTYKLLASTCLAETNIVQFVDANPVNQGRVLRGVPVVSPSELNSRTTTVVVGSVLHAAAIVDDVRRSGFAHRIVTLTD